MTWLQLTYFSSGSGGVGFAMYPAVEFSRFDFHSDCDDASQHGRCYTITPVFEASPKGMDLEVPIRSHFKLNLTGHRCLIELENVRHRAHHLSNSNSSICIISNHSQASELNSLQA